VLKTCFASQSADIDAVIAHTGRQPEAVVFVPMVG